jgi:ADP-heptose:LPS heptosyltransferase
MPQASPSVLLVRLDALGDALALAPLLAAFRDRDIPVDLVLRENNAEAFSDRAARRRFLAPFDLRSDTAANQTSIAAFAAQLRPNAYSHVLVATEDSSGYRLAAAIGAPVRAGFVHGWGKPLKRIWARQLLTQTVYRSAGLDRRAPHECSVLFELGRELLGPAATPSRDGAVLRPLVLERDAGSSNRVAMQVTDKYERLGMPFDGVVALVRALQQCYPLHLLAAAGEAPFADGIERAAGVTVDRFDALPPWKAAIAQAPLLLAPDSGATHVAGMVGTPCVAVFAATRDFALQAARWAPWAAPYRIVRGDAGWPERALDAAAALLSGKR